VIANTPLNAPVWRVVATRNPPIRIFELVVPPESPEAHDALVDLEIAFSPHYNQLKLMEAGLPRTEWVHGPGAGYIMAPFVYRTPGRFSDGRAGVFYAGLEEVTALREVAYHRAQFLAKTDQAPMFLDEALLTARIEGSFTDIRGARDSHPHLYAKDTAQYAPAQAWAAGLRATGTDGILYGSVRWPEGSCAAVFHPKVVRNCRMAKVLRFWWDGGKVTPVP